MRIVCTGVNHLDPPPGVQEYLTRYGGRNLFGEPNFRVVWSNSRVVKRTRRFIDTDPHGNVIRQAVATKFIQRYNYPATRDRFVIERWRPAEFYGDPEAWQRKNTKLIDGHLVQPIGEYPARGEYEHVDTVEWVDDFGAHKFAWPTREYVKFVVDSVGWVAGLSTDEIAAQLTAEDEAADNAMFEHYLTRVKDASRPFGGIQPFVSLAGLKGLH